VVSPLYPFVDLALARRLETAEGRANVGFVEARARLDASVGATCMTAGGALAMFDGPGSPMTQTFGLGIHEPVTDDTLDTLEWFFRSRGASVCHEVSPLAGVEVYARLHRRGYVPIEASSVMFRPVDVPVSGALNPRLRVREVTAADGDVYTAAVVKGWSEFPAVQAFLEGIARITMARDDSPSVIAELDGVPIATGAMNLWDGTALMAGACTVPEGRRQGAQLALLDARLRMAAARECDLAMMVAAPGSASQRNAERQGFRIAYTRLKWELI
jgi:hypothetical protein